MRSTFKRNLLGCEPFGKMKSVVFWILVGGVVAFATAEVIENTRCDSGRDAIIKSTTQEISVEPCPQAATGAPCVLYRGSNATITIKFTPEEEPTQRLRSTIAWVKQGRDLGFRGMKSNACSYMNCPLRANEEQVFSANLALSSSLPTGVYPLKVKIQEIKGSKTVFACQLFDIKLSDPSSEED